MNEPLRTALGQRLVLNRANTAARSGDLAEALRLLDQLDDEGSATPGALDLRARVHAQRGELTEADGCWARVLVLAPDDAGAEAGRRTIARITAGHRPVRPRVRAGRLAVAAAAAVTVTVLVGWPPWPVPGSGGQPAHAVVGQDLGATQAREIDALRHQLASIDAGNAAASAERAAAADRLAADLDAIARGLSAPGVEVHRRASDVLVVFDVGLFPRGTRLSGAGAALLARVGRALAGLRVTTTVVGHAVAVPGGPGGGGSSVALARAEVAAGRLAAGGLPFAALSLTSADQAQGPFPDPARNRTVTLVVTPDGPGR